MLLRKPGPRLSSKLSLFSLYSEIAWLAFRRASNQLDNYFVLNNLAAYLFKLFGTMALWQPEANARSPLADLRILCRSYTDSLRRKESSGIGAAIGSAANLEVIAMRRTAMQRVWVDGGRVDRVDQVPNTEPVGSKLWNYGWGALFVIVMTLLSVFGPRTAYSKLPPASQVVSQPAPPVIK